MTDVVEKNSFDSASLQLGLETLLHTSTDQITSKDQLRDGLRKSERTNSELEENLRFGEERCVNEREKLVVLEAEMKSMSTAIDVTCIVGMDTSQQTFEREQYVTRTTSQKLAEQEEHVKAQLTQAIILKAETLMFRHQQKEAAELTTVETEMLAALKKEAEQNREIASRAAALDMMEHKRQEKEEKLRLLLENDPQVLSALEMSLEMGFQAAMKLQKAKYAKNNEDNEAFAKQQVSLGERLTAAERSEAKHTKNIQAHAAMLITKRTKVIELQTEKEKATLAAVSEARKLKDVQKQGKEARETLATVVKALQIAKENVSSLEVELAIKEETISEQTRKVQAERERLDKQEAEATGGDKKIDKAIKRLETTLASQEKKALGKEEAAAKIEVTLLGLQNEVQALQAEEKTLKQEELKKKSERAAAALKRKSMEENEGGKGVSDRQAQKKALSAEIKKLKTQHTKLVNKLKDAPKDAAENLERKKHKKQADALKAKLSSQDQQKTLDDMQAAFREGNQKEGNEEKKLDLILEELTYQHRALTQADLSS